MHYIMLQFRFLYVGLRKTIKDLFKWVGKKKLAGKNPGISNRLTNRHPVRISCDFVFQCHDNHNNKCK